MLHQKYIKINYYRQKRQPLLPSIIFIKDYSSRILNIKIYMQVNIRFLHHYHIPKFFLRETKVETKRTYSVPPKPGQAPHVGFPKVW